jgi:hypothetical protein
MTARHWKITSSKLVFRIAFIVIITAWDAAASGQDAAQKAAATVRHPNLVLGRGTDLRAPLRSARDVFPRGSGVSL